ncbi:hypothetical protein G5714_001618 [Onychostoma macrolepis]|uniref:Uncharacterized protein n=1 Tax=Onychostoma macrolepis TaxID=369639 RepID=A0A7J6DDF7_9TELE|nr:hypothetical protein G5714_001618 [Onychostoma macrolepis]
MGKQVNLGVIISSNYAVNKANEISQLNNRQLWQMEPYPHRSREAPDLKCKRASSDWEEERRCHGAADIRDGCHESTRLIQALTDFPSKTNQQTADRRGGKWLLLKHACNQGTEFK